MARLTTALTSFFCAALWANNAFAFHNPWSGGGGTPAPEIDGSGALMAIALLVSVGAIVYRGLRRQAA